MHKTITIVSGLLCLVLAARSKQPEDLLSSSTVALFVSFLRSLAAGIPGNNDVLREMQEMPTH